MTHIANKLQDLKTVWKQNASIRFLTWVVVSYFIWTGVSWAWIVKSAASDGLSFHLTKVTTQFLNLIGFNAHQIGCTVFVDEERGVFVGNSCNGLDFFGLFTCFVLAYPIAFKYKWWFMLAGILSIHILNITRLVLLVVIYVKSPENFDFNHHYTFVIVIYSTLFFMWLIWAKKYRAYVFIEE